MVFIPKPNKSHSNPFNFRPISLLNIIGKLLEKIVTNRFLYFLEYHNILSDFQFGFRPNRSTHQALHLISNTLNNSNVNKQGTFTITRDVYKAFDTVWWRGLLYKIFHLPDNQLDFTSFIYNYLDRRQIHIYFNSILTTSFYPKAGVPQGSSLGPILYLLYVNDTPLPTYPNTVISRFADDIVHVIVADRNIYKAPKRINHLKSKLKVELNKTQKWENDWKIQCNVNKTKIAIRGTKIKTVDRLGGIKLNNTPLHYSSTVTILGHRFDNNKNSHSQTLTQVARANTQLQNLYRFKCAPSKIKLHLYKTLIRPILEYPSTLLSTTSKTDIQKLQKVQNRALRFIFDTQWDDFIPNTTLHRRAKIPSMHDRLANLTKKFITKLKDVHFQDRLEPIYKYDNTYNIIDPPYFDDKRDVKACLQQFGYNPPEED